jgi:hypothetical protein
MFTNPYQTTALRAVVIKPLLSQLQAAASRRELVQVLNDQGEPILGLYEVPAVLTDVKPFNHPVAFESFGKAYTVIDTRAFVRSTTEGKRVIQSPFEYTMAVLRGALTLGWAQRGSGDFLAMLGDLPARVFVNTVSRAIKRRMGISDADEVRLRVVTAFYYYSLFHDAGKLDETMVTNEAKRVIRITAAPPQQVYVIIEQLESGLGGLEDYAHAITKVIDNPRTEHLSGALILTMLGGLWFGAAAKEIVAVSLEFPPYFVAMCYLAAAQRGLNKIEIGKEVILQGQRNGVGDAFVRGVQGYINYLSED